ncbi:MAG: hypothetical protein FWD84_01250 [Oscillospiraceae bacterium]|nr:hypothetical protein [Oscillospiraceae bacterium]
MSRKGVVLFALGLLAVALLFDVINMDRGGEGMDSPDRTDILVRHERACWAGFEPGFSVIDSHEELMAYYERHAALCEANEFTDDCALSTVLMSYTPAQFRLHYLVIVRPEADSGSVRFEVQGIRENGEIVIERLVPEIMTMDLVYHYIILGVPRDFHPPEFTVVFVDQEA